jgi:integrase
MTLAEFVSQKFELHVIARREPGGQKHYRFWLRKHILPAVGAVELAEFTPDHAESLIAAKHAAGYSGQTLHHLKFALSAIFRHAIHLRLYPHANPALGVELPASRPRRRATYTCAQLSAVLARLKSPIREMALLGVACSLGPSELCGLRIAHANLTSVPAELDGEALAPFSLAIRENWYEGKRGRLKTGTRRRNVPITAELAAQLSELVRQAKIATPDAPLFQARTGKPIDSHNASNRIFRPLAKELGFAVTWYGFRRAHSTLAALTGACVDDRKLVMGHADGRMTLYYDIADVERMRAVPERILARIKQLGAIA